MNEPPASSSNERQEAEPNDANELGEVESATSHNREEDFPRFQELPLINFMMVDREWRTKDGQEVIAVLDMDLPSLGASVTETGEPFMAPDLTSDKAPDDCNHTVVLSISQQIRNDADSGWNIEVIP